MTTDHTTLTRELCSLALSANFTAPPLPPGVFSHPELGELHDGLQMLQYGTSVAVAMLEAAIAAASRAPAAVPAGWKLVPTAGPTTGMIAAACWRDTPQMRRDYCAMVEAAPSAPCAVPPPAGEPAPAPAPAVVAPTEAIGRLLAQAMDQAVSNGANSVSMPDEYVEIAAWLAATPNPEGLAGEGR